jgi:large subunit ribosomal protein L2
MQRIFKPVTPSLRHTILLNKTNLSKKPFTKTLLKGFSKTNGKNNQGKITVRHRGGGHKQLYRDISFKRNLVTGTVKSIEYDPNRSANIACIQNNNTFYYILAFDGIVLGDFIESGDKVPIKPGNSLPLRYIPIGSLVHNVSLKPNQKGQLLRSAGTYGQLIQKIDNKYAQIKLSSGSQQIILLDCFATLGIVSNLAHKNIKKGKAGRSRWLNIRPKVRGVAKNPVDHPHGGGEGKTSGGRPSVTFKGWITKGRPTRNKKKSNKFIIK